jgi:hypothetical protein
MHLAPRPPSRGCQRLEATRACLVRSAAAGAREPPELDASILADAEPRAEAPAALGPASAVPVVAATSRLQHAAIARRPGAAAPGLERTAHHSLPTAPVHAGCVDGHTGDGAIGLRRRVRAPSARPNGDAREPEPRARRASPPSAAHSPSGAGFQRVKCFSSSWSTWLKQRPMMVSDRIPTYMFGIWKLY